MTSPIGQTIANRRLEASLGTGELGEVFRVINIDTGRTEALRLFPTGLSTSPGFADRFAIEAASLATLDHPNVVKVFAGGQEGGRCFLAMEYVPDGSLRSLLQRRPGGAPELTINQGIDLLHQAAEGLAYIHRQGRLHRNLKPESLLLARAINAVDSYMLKIGDFGVSQLIDANSTPADGINLSARSAIYTPPEQFQGQQFDQRSDIYVLGIVLYEAVTGSLPFTIRSFDEGYAKHVGAQPRPPREVRPDLPPELEVIMLRCLAKRPGDRYGAAAELAAALQQLQKTRAEAAPVENDKPPVLAPLADPSPMPRVQVADRKGTVVQVAALSGDGLMVGRSGDNDIGLDHPLVADEHALIDWDGTQAQVTDLGSSSGTLLGGERLPPNVARPWPADQLLRVGPYWMRMDPPRKGAANGAGQGSAAPAPVPVPQPVAAATTGQQPAVQQPPAKQSALTSIFPAVGRQAAPPPPPPLEPGEPGAGEVLVRHIIVNPEQKALTLTPGQPAQCTVQLTNQGNRVDHLTIEIEGVQPKWWKGPEEPVQLNPAERRTVTLQINVPQEPESRAQTYPVRVRARSDNKRELGEAAAQWTVLPFFRSNLWVPHRRRGGLMKARYTIGVKNEGNAPTSYAVSGRDEEEDGSITYDAEPAQLTPEPGTTARSVVTVRSRPHLYGRPVRREFTIAVAPKHETEQKTQLAYFTQHPFIPWWLLPLLAVCLVVGVIIAYFMSIPRIVVFEPLDRNQVVVRDTVVARWNVRPDAAVVLKINRTPVPKTLDSTGVYSYTTGGTPVVFSLEASNWRGYIVAPTQEFLVEVITETPTNTATPRPTFTAEPTGTEPPTETVPPTAPPPPTAPNTATASATRTATITVTPTSVLPCPFTPDPVVVGRDPLRATTPTGRRVPVLVYLVRTRTDGSTSEEIVGGGTTDANGFFRIPISIRNQRADYYKIVVRERYTGRTLSEFLCDIPASPTRTAIPPAATPEAPSGEGGG